MSNSIKGENKLEGASNYRAWKKRIDLILENNRLGSSKRKSEETYGRIK